MKQLLFSASLTLGIFALTPGLASAQGGFSSANPASSGDTQSQSAGQKSKAAVAQVGAGTTSSATNGNSGPKRSGGASNDPLQLPPLPAASECDFVKNTGAHRGCLEIVLRHKRKDAP